MTVLRFSTADCAEARVSFVFLVGNGVFLVGVEAHRATRDCLRPVDCRTTKPCTCRYILATKKRRKMDCLIVKGLLIVLFCTTPSPFFLRQRQRELMDCVAARSSAVRFWPARMYVCCENQTCNPNMSLNSFGSTIRRGRPRRIQLKNPVVTTRHPNRSFRSSPCTVCCTSHINQSNDHDFFPRRPSSFGYSSRRSVWSDPFL